MQDREFLVGTTIEDQAISMLLQMVIFHDLLCCLKHILQKGWILHIQ